MIKREMLEAAILKGDFEGGEQLVLPDNDIIPEVIEYHVFLSPSMIGRNKDGSQEELFTDALKDLGIEAKNDDLNNLFCNPSESVRKNITITKVY